MSPLQPQPRAESISVPDDGHISSSDAAARIQAALEHRSTRSWSVVVLPSGHGWLHITAPPERCVPDRTDVTPRRRLTDLVCLTAEDERELTRLLGLWPECPYGIPVPPSVEFYWEFIDRAETGRTERPASWSFD